MYNFMLDFLGYRVARTDLLAELSFLFQNDRRLGLKSGKYVAPLKHLNGHLKILPQ